VQQRRSSAASVVLAVAGIALGGVALAVRPAAPEGEGRALVTIVEQRLREAAAGLGSRLGTLSELPRLAAAVATDEATVRDLTDEELAFRPRPGETLTIAQRFSDGRVVTLLTLPASAPPMSRTAPGLELRPMDGQLLLAQTARIVPRERASELVGLLTATTPVALADVGQQLRRSGLGGRLEVDGIPLPLAERDPAASPRELALPLALPGGLSGQVRLVLTGVASAQQGLTYGLGGAGALLLLIAGALALRRGGGQVAPPGAPDETFRPSTVTTAVERPLPAPAGPRPSPLSSVTPAPLTPAAPVQLRGGRPERIGRYQILRQLGEGGMAEVYLARGEGEAGFEKLVALKLLQPTLAMQAAVVEVFLDEAKVVAGLDHPNIVQTHDLGRSGAEYFIAMEYIDGSDLARLNELVCDRGEKIPLPVALAILRKLCDGLHAAHTALAPDGHPLNLVHRDVKAANVFVSRTGVTKIGDFGIAKINHEMRVARTEIGQVKGTPGYMAPEHRVGGAVDRRADVFGVAAVAYELFTGRPVNLDTVLLIAHGLEGWPHLPPITDLRPEAPPELDAIVKRGLAYNRDERTADCAVFEQELKAVADRLGVADDKEVGKFVTEQLRWVAARAATQSRG
jgi:hypothetical protein